MLVMVGVRTEAHIFRSQVGIGSESDCLLGQLKRILDISNSDAGLKGEKLEGSVRGEGECGDEVEVLLVREICRLACKTWPSLSWRDVKQSVVSVCSVLNDAGEFYNVI